MPLCSTPFGIIGIFTHATSGSSATASCAQRLSASLESSLPRPLLLVNGLKVLNAFRHHWNLHSSTSAGSGSSPPRAQRLSASLESSPEHRLRAQLYSRWVLNAFRHHWNLHSSPAV